MSAPKIRFIVNTVSSELDRNGNRSHLARITSTITGKHLVFISDGTRNAESLAYKAAGNDYETIHNIESTVPVKQWKSAAKSVTRYESATTIEEIAALEVMP